MMTDRELLELAAKAAGIKLGEWAFPRAATTNNGLWAPLDDDGDAFRLAVKLRFSIDHNEPQDDDLWVLISHSDGGAIAGNSINEEADRAFFTRRTIVEAAAELQKNGSKLEKSDL